MKSLQLILYFKFLEILRQIKDNLFTLFFLGPIILWFVYMLAVPYIDALAVGSYPILSTNSLQLLATILVFLFLLSSLSDVVAEIYPIQSPDSYLDALPIATNWRFFSLLIIRITRTIPLLVVIGLLNFLVAKIANKPSQTLSLILFILLPIALQLAALQILLVIFATHFKQIYFTRILLVFFAISLITYLFPTFGWCLGLPFIGIRELLILIYNNLSGNSNGLSSIDSVISLIMFIFLASLALIGYQKWAIADREAVEQILAKKRYFSDLIGRNFVFAKIFGLRLGAHLLRDLILTFRFFSAAVYLSFAFAIIFEISLLAIVRNTDYPMDIVSQAVTALATFSLAALAPALVKHQLPFLWLERSLPVSGQDMSMCKLIYACLISLPIPIISFLLSLALKPLALNEESFLLFQLMLVWLTVSSLVGILSFEIASRPLLAILFIAIGSLAIAVLVIQVWWIWFILYPYLMDKLLVRGRERARILIIGLEGDND
jgi:hypothetical protein